MDINAIYVENLRKAYGKFQLKDISFSLPEGSIMGFIGENGAGKLTTIKNMLNLTHRDSGKISLLGMDLDKNEKKIKEEIGVVLEECNFHDNLKVSYIPKFMKNIYNLFSSSGNYFFHYICEKAVSCTNNTRKMGRYSIYNCST